MPETLRQLVTAIHDFKQASADADARSPLADRPLDGEDLLTVNVLG